MATFQCTVCGETIKKDIETCCSSSIVPCREKEVFCCGRPMMEVMD